METPRAQLFTIASFASHHGHAGARLLVNEKYEVDTISLTDLLREHRAPTQIDYLSINTEGSEYPILGHFDSQSTRSRLSQSNTTMSRTSPTEFNHS